MIFKLFSNIQLATAVFETRSTQHTHLTLATTQLTAGSSLVCRGGGGGRRTPGIFLLCYAHVRWPAGPMGKPYRRTRAASLRYSRHAIENGPAEVYLQPVVREQENMKEAYEEVEVQDNK